MNLLICFVLSRFMTMTTVARPLPSAIASVSGDRASEGIASPACKARVRPGDTVFAWNGTPIETFAQFQRAVGATPGELVCCAHGVTGRPWI